MVCMSPIDNLADARVHTSEGASTAITATTVTTSYCSPKCVSFRQFRYALDSPPSSYRIHVGASTMTGRDDGNQLAIPL